MVGIKEVAKSANVSISTVSYALNGSNKVSEATRNRIKDIAKNLGYTPKLAARTLKGNKTNIIGVYVSGFQGEFYGELLDGVQHQLETLGYDMMVNSGNRTQKFLNEKLFDGAIVLDKKFHNNELQEALDGGSKIVALDRHLQHKNARTVLLDNRPGAQEAVEYLLNQHMDKYYLVSGPLGNYDMSIRLDSALERFEKDKVPVEIIEGDFTEQSGFDAAEQIVKSTGQHTAGVFTFSDDEACGFYRYLKNDANRISKQFKLVGFDNNRSADLLNPVFPSISYHKHLWGETAASTLVDLIENKASVEDKLIKTSLSYRH